jgi:hypothetical protein
MGVATAVADQKRFALGTPREMPGARRRFGGIVLV